MFVIRCNHFTVGCVRLVTEDSLSKGHDTISDRSSLKIPIFHHLEVVLLVLPFSLSTVWDVWGCSGIVWAMTEQISRKNSCYLFFLLGGEKKKPKGCGCCVQECRPKCCWFEWVWGLRQSFLASAVHLRSWNHYTAVRKWKYLLVFVWNSCRCTSVVTGPSLRLVKPIQNHFLYVRALWTVSCRSEILCL